MTITQEESDICERCGNTSCHDELCDVILGDPVEINFHPFEVLHGEIVRRALRIDPDAPLEGEKAVRFLTALGKAYDATKIVNLDGILLSSKERLDRRTSHGDDPTVAWAPLQKRITAYIANGGSILDPEEEVGMPFADRVRALTYPNYTRVLMWSFEDWEEWEYWARECPADDRPTTAWLAEHFDTPAASVRSLMMHWNPTFFVGSRERQARRQGWKTRR